VSGGAIVPVDILRVTRLPGGCPIAIERTVPVAVVVAVIIGEKRQVVGRTGCIKTFDIGEIKENLFVGSAVSANLFVADRDISGGTRANEVSSHVHEFDVRVVCFQRVHRVEILLDLGLGAVHLAAPRPDDHVNLRIRVEISASRRGPSGAIGRTKIVGNTQATEVRIKVDQVKGAARPRPVEGEEIVREAVCREAVHKSHEARHTIDQLTSVGGMTVSDVKRRLSQQNRRGRDCVDLGAGMIDNDCLLSPASDGERKYRSGKKHEPEGR